MAMPAIDAILAGAAFGSEPGTWPLPTAATPHQLWLRAVAAGGQGRFASARADLAAVLRGPSAGPLSSLAHSTQASFLRQLGWHSLARGWDGRAVALAGADPEARADALIGLAADALGMGRFAASATLLDRARVLTAGHSRWGCRVAVRRSWVGAELAMVTGDGVAAVRHAETARTLAAALGDGWGRHRAKSEVVLAAALCCAGQVDRSRTVAGEALETTARLGLVPLQWAVACLLADIGSARHREAARQIRGRCAELIRDRGGAFRPVR